MRQFLRFAVVGLLQNGVNLAVFAVTIGVGVPYLLAAIVAAAIALAVSFLLNRLWTFPGRSTRTATRAARYVTIWVTILLLGLPVLALLVSLAHLPRILAQALVILVGAPISYVAQRHWTFSHRLD